MAAIGITMLGGACDFTCGTWVLCDLVSPNPKKICEPDQQGLRWCHKVDASNSNQIWFFLQSQHCLQHIVAGCSCITAATDAQS